MYTKPIFFERNRVGRVYTGGKLFHDFFGDEAVDGYMPEEWIASGVKAKNEGSTIYNEGVSKVKDTNIYFDELLEAYPNELLGKNKKFRILVKGLDSSIRLPAQAHPDKAFSKKYFNSQYGKTECWMILGTRPNAKIYFGFKDGVTKSDFEAAIDASETDSSAMEKLMCEIEPQIGDVYLVPARTVHAIGSGCLILEIQEPTDFTIQPERYCGEYRLSDNEMYLGLSREDAVSCFDFTTSPDTKMKPVVIESKNGYVKESIVSNANTDCFVINKITLKNGEYSPSIDDNYAVYIVTNGDGSIVGDSYNKELGKGDYFFMPAKAMGKYKITGDIDIVECF